MAEKGKLVVNQLREDVAPAAVIAELMLGYDSALKVDCAGPRANFIQPGWFMFPKGTLSTNVDVERAT